MPVILSLNIKFSGKRLLSSKNPDIEDLLKDFITWCSRCVAKTNCENCRNIIMKTSMGDATENEKYLEFREYQNIDEDAPTVTKLIRPTAFFTKVVETQLAAFNRIWQHYWCSTKILNKITNECIDLTNKIHLEWLDQNNACYNHRLQALKYMISLNCILVQDTIIVLTKYPVHPIKK
ncbi:hypothetical protein ACFW04_012762 [Cataglyphis niger]